MGMFDSVHVICPYCGERTDLQSKVGRCNLDNYTLNNAPIDILEDLASGGGWTECDNCKKEIEVKRNLYNRSYYVDEYFNEDSNPGKDCRDKKFSTISSLEKRIKRLEHELGIKNEE